MTQELSVDPTNEFQKKHSQTAIGSSRHHTWASFCAVVLTLLFSSQVGAGDYSFTLIADDTGTYSSVDLPSINNSGTVAFQAFLAGGGQGIFVRTGGTTATIADDSGKFSVLANRLSINDSGTVVFAASLDSGGQGIYSGNGGPISTIADSEGIYRSFGHAVINNSAISAFAAGLDTGGTIAIYRGSGSVITRIADDSGPFSGFGSEVSISDRGTIAFRAQLDVGDVGLFASNGTTTTPIVDTSGTYSSFGPGLAINSDDKVVSRASLDSGGQAILVGDGGSVTIAADTNGAFSGLAAWPSINTDGSIAFIAGLNGGGHGIFTGQDPVAHKVIAVGDILDGNSVVELRQYSYSLNDRGEIVFWAWLTSGRKGVFVAKPASTVLIDIKPGNNTNRINLRKATKVAVAVLTSSIADGDPIDFDATQVDPTTLLFGPGEASATRRARIKDVDRDGDSDLVAQFSLSETGIACGDIEATLGGSTYAGELFSGADAIETAGCK